ncbi:MAG: hypothetical protein JW931_07660 [Methanomicrobiaceae archaeon]|nr:hypothetical protein [Methanomicrobiaceae archaeon]
MFGLEREELSLVGSYSSFFGLLLIATILSYRSIYYFVLENFIIRIPPYYDYLAIIASLTIFGLIFLIIPAVPISSDILENFRKRNFRLMLMLTFVVLIYVIALLFQMVHVHIDVTGELISLGGA